MKERTLLVGGELFIGAGDRGGTQLRLRVPVAAPERPAR
jgi:signal transduction histidine kinase